MKQHFSALLIAAILLVLGLSASAAADAVNLYFTSGEETGTETPSELPADYIRIYQTGSARYLLLPAGWDASRLRAVFSGVSQITVNGQSLQSGDSFAAEPGGTLKISYKGQSLSVRVLQSANIPAVFLTTASGNIEALKKDKTVRESGLCRILNADGTEEYGGALTYLRTRGNASFYYPKKSFQLKLEHAAPLFGMNADRKWVLLANYVDKSLLRNTIAYGIARYAGVYSYVPGTQPVDVYLNHQYYGSFLLTEKCEIDKDRLAIDDLEKRSEAANPSPLESYPSFGERLYGLKRMKGAQLESDPEDITGGYLLLANSRVYYAWEPSGFVTAKGQAFTLDQPKYASEKQVAYLSGLFQQIENALFSKDGNDPETGKHWDELLDQTTFVHRYLLAEVTADYDGQKPYFYKNADILDTMVYCAPVWDQDATFGANSKYNRPARFYICNDRSLSYLWFPQAMKLPDFKAAVLAEYRRVYAPALRILLGQETDPGGVLRSLDEYAEEIGASAALDHIRWPIGKNRATNFNMSTGSDPEANVRYLRNFIEKRLAFLDKQWGQ